MPIPGLQWWRGLMFGDKQIYDQSHELDRNHNSRTTNLQTTHLQTKMITKFCESRYKRWTWKMQKSSPHPRGRDRAAWKSKVWVQNCLLTFNSNLTLKDYQGARKCSHSLGRKITHPSWTTKCRWVVLRGNSALWLLFINTTLHLTRRFTDYQFSLY